MGVSILIGVADGDTPAAAIYSRTSGRMIGRIFEGTDAAEQAEAFLAWVTEGRWSSFGSFRHTGDGRDPRHFDDAALDLLRKTWADVALHPETGLLREPEGEEA